MSNISRREFLGALSTVIVSAGAVGADASPRLYPPEDLSYFDRPIEPRGEMTFGYHAITWEGDDVRAVKDISEIGFRGVQFRTNILKEFGGRPEALRDLLAKHKLTFVALSSGGVGLAPANEADEIARHLGNARFVNEAGGLYLQLTDSARIRGRSANAEDFKKLGRMLTEIGKRSIDLGVPVGYHNHMNSLGEAPDDVDRILESADARYVKFELDVAHYTQGGGNPLRAIKQHADRLLFLHIKDLESPVAGDQSRKYRFVELGRGKVDLPGIFKALEEVRFSGWAVVELDSVPDKTRTPKECALISKKYLEDRIGARI